MYTDDIRIIKHKLRDKYKKIRFEISSWGKAQMDEAIRNNFLSIKHYSRAKVILTYLSKEIEVDTFGIFKAAKKNNKRVAVPRCIAGCREMEFYFINSLCDLEKGSFGLMEPIPSRCAKLIDFSQGICIVPGFSFDENGYRLGYGKGYYDRFLCKFGGLKVGICYSICMRENLPHSRYDYPVDIVITENYIKKITIGRTYT